MRPRHTAAEGPMQPVTTPAASECAVTTLRGRRLVLARAAWLAVAGLALTMFVAGLPVRYNQFRTLARTDVSPDWTPEAMRAALAQLGLSAGFYAAYFSALAVAVALGALAVAAVIVRRRPDDGLALLVALFLVTFGTSFTGVMPALVGSHPAWLVPFQFVFAFNLIAFFLVCALFPDGRFVPRWTRPLALVWCPVVLYEAVNGQSSPFRHAWLVWPLWVGAWLVAVGAQIYRYRRISGPVQRQQTKWVVSGITAMFLALVVLVGIVPTVLPPSLSRPDLGVLYEMAMAPVLFGAFLLVPLTVGIAILRYRLWDIDVLINRALVYGALTACVVGLYVLAVGGTGALLGSGGNVVVSLVATSLVAVLFQPLRQRLQRGVNHLMYGERDDPYAVLSRLGQHLDAALAPDAVLPTIVTTVKEALKLPYAAIALREEGHFAIAAAAGTPVADPLSMPLVYQGEPVGQLLVSPRAPGEGWSPADRRLLDDLAHHAGVAVHGVRLTTDLQRLTADLQRSRERLVLAREEERRRLRRDLHDDLAPTLASLGLTAVTAADLIPTDPAAAGDLVRELHTAIRAAVGDIRRLVYDLRPPTLDELGLVAAVRERAEQYSGHQGHGRASGEPSSCEGLAVTVAAPECLPPLPAAVEVAAYRILQEALMNVSRHARARTCVIRLALTEADGGARRLLIEVADDGVGLPAVEERRAGVGLRSMRERAAELGGDCVIERREPAGTRVAAWLPLAEASGGRR